MAPLIVRQLSILLWKCWIMRRRHWISTIFEFFFPIVIALVMVAANNAPKDPPNQQSSHNEQSDQGWQQPTYYKRVTNYTIGQLFDGREDDYTNYTYDIYYTPVTPFTQQLMQEFAQLNQVVPPIPFEDEDNMMANMTEGEEYNEITIGYVFDGDISEDTVNDIVFTIRIKHFSMSRLTENLFPYKYYSGPVSEYDSGRLYDSTAFARAQIAMSETIMSHLAHKYDIEKTATNVSKVVTHEIPYPGYMKLFSFGGDISMMDVIGMMIVMGYIVMAPLIVKRITDEKVAKAKEMLRMMGMSDWVFWGSHFINFFTVMFVQSIVLTVLYCYGFGNTTYVLYSNALVFFIALMLYNITNILSSMLLTTVFNRPVIAVVASVILFQASHAVPLALLSPMYRKNIDFDASNPWRIVTCFLPNAGFQWFLSLVGQCEAYGYGVTWSNLWDEVPVYGTFAPGLVLLMQFLSIFFYVFLIWYVDNVWPFQYGIPKPVYYLFLPSYWFPKSSQQTMTSIEGNDHKENREHFECEPMNTRVGIKCENLKKKFGPKLAVNDMSLNIYSGQITVLLGHNGAGKTTTMNMITGIFPPTNGTAYVDGYDIRHQTKSARRSMALCPQENILYNELDVYQHLKLYAILKDHPGADVDHEIHKIVEMVSLSDKIHTLSTALSGGMKRKLSLGIAMIANSKILILDEPTSGMDPEARRHIWDVLQTIRTERTILLTTHYMEEADALGDRIAIMNEGSVKCCGTPMFLKKAFGAGYQLRIAKNSTFNAQTVLAIVRNFMPNADIKSEINSEIIYSLESSDNNHNCEPVLNTSSLLAKLFCELEQKKVELHIESCGLTVTTMEDVFLKVGNEFNDNEMNFKTNGNKDFWGKRAYEERLFHTFEKNSGFRLFMQQFMALLFKRFHYAKRFWPMIVFQLVIPGLLFMVTLLIDYTMKDSMKRSSPALQLNLAMYGQTEGFISLKDIDSKFSDIYVETAKSQKMTAHVINENPNNWTLDEHRGDDINRYIKTYLVGAQINNSDSGLELIPWYNREASHSLPTSINLLYETLLRVLLPKEQTSLTVINHPIPEDDTTNIAYTVMITTIITCMVLVPLTVPFIGASYVLFPTHERVTNSKQIQLMTGISTVVFWSASLLFDVINHFIASVFIFIVFVIFDWNQVFLGSSATAVGLFLMFFLFGLASIPLAYLFSLRLKKPSTGYAVLVILYLVTGMILVMAMGFVDLSLVAEKKMTKSTYNTIVGFAKVLPIFSMSFGIQKLYKIGSFQNACEQTLQVYLDSKCVAGKLDNTDAIWGCCPNLCKPTGDCYADMNALNWDSFGVGSEFTYLIVTSIIFLFILWLIEGNLQRILYFFDNLWGNKKFIQQTECSQTAIPGIPTNNIQELVLDINTGQWTRPVYHEDSDVTEEKRRIDDLFQRLDISSEAIVVKELTKTFGKLIPIQAVRQLSFGVHKEEVFGLLGVNGAGKTTTFRMLTGDETLSAGNSWIQNYGLKQDLKQFQQQIGYCPQFDALLDKLTGSETLYMFCRLRGMAENTIKDYVKELVEMVGLGKHVNKCTETYSGGNKRKLSLAIALCAAPPVIFLDEPTSGVDPSARRKIWSTLAYLQERYGSAFILTSHSMEECEALCSRVAIMVNGQLQCLGSVQHLRQKFGQGFTVMAKLKRDLVGQSAYMADIQNYFAQQMPSAVLKDVHQCLLHYHITDSSMLWSKMFSVMEDMKTKYSLEDYIISDTTLEQIFLSFARNQR